jgi:hypothetical protein
MLHYLSHNYFTSKDACLFILANLPMCCNEKNLADVNSKKKTEIIRIRGCFAVPQTPGAKLAKSFIQSNVITVKYRVKWLF